MRIWGGYLFILMVLLCLSLPLFPQEWGRDPFQPPEEESEVVPPPPVEEEAPSELTLAGTLVSPKGAVAIINEKIVKEGESIGGFKVLRIERKRVILTREGKSYSLYLGRKKEVKETK